jgi:hypothetical protein
MDGSPVLSALFFRLSHPPYAVVEFLRAGAQLQVLLQQLGGDDLKHSCVDDLLSVFSGVRTRRLSSCARPEVAVGCDRLGGKMRILGIVWLCASLRAVAGTSAHACEDGHWIDEVLADGQILKLEDGSLWKVEAVDAVTSSHLASSFKRHCLRRQDCERRRWRDGSCAKNTLTRGMSRLDAGAG